MKIHIHKLKELLSKAVKKNCTSERTGLIFSAGVDSTLLGILAAEFTEVVAYTVGIDDAPDLIHAGELSGKLNFEIRLIETSLEEIEDSIHPVLKVVNDPNPMQVGVGIPFYLASKRAAEDGIKLVLSGQGADELFGGYNRYLGILESGGYPALEKAMEEDVKNIHRDNLDRDIAICRMNGIGLRAPYLENRFKDYSLKIPPELKIKEVKEEEFRCIDEIDSKRFIRKYILRKLAGECGVPPAVLNRPKKAAQYGSGTNKALQKIAKKRGFRKLRPFIEFSVSEMDD